MERILGIFVENNRSKLIYLSRATSWTCLSFDPPKVKSTYIPNYFSKTDVEKKRIVDIYLIKVFLVNEINPVCFWGFLEYYIKSVNLTRAYSDFSPFRRQIFFMPTH